MLQLLVELLGLSFLQVLATREKLRVFIDLSRKKLSQQQNVDITQLD